MLPDRQGCGQDGAGVGRSVGVRRRCLAAVPHAHTSARAGTRGLRAHPHYAPVHGS